MTGGEWATTITAGLSFIGMLISVYFTRSTACKMADLQNKHAEFLEQSRQKHQLSLAAIDKRLEVHQTALRLAVDLGAQIVTSQGPGKPFREDKTVRELQIDGIEWLIDHHIYLGEEVGYKLLEAFTSADVKQVSAALDAIEQATGLPGLNQDWQPFWSAENRKTKSPTQRPDST